MQAPPAAPLKTAKKSFLSFLAWWQVDPADLEQQLAQYYTMGAFQSARRISALLCVLSAAITVLLGGYLLLSASTVIEGLLWGTLGYLMFRGRRWAFIVGMLAWTIEKGFMIFVGFSTGHPPIGQFIWWAVYMNAFFLAYRVESERARHASGLDPIKWTREC